MTCDNTIAWYDNVPLLSWLVLRAKCRHCGARISPVYPAVELAVGLLWLSSYLVYGLTWSWTVLAYVAVISVALAAIDIRHHRLPHRIVMPSYGVVAALCAVAWIVGERETWWIALAGFALLGGFYGLLWFFYPKGMGFGDVTTAGLLGLTAGFLGMEQLAVAALAGPLVGGIIVVVLAAFKRVSRGTPIPYGPALIGGAWIGFLWGEPIAGSYLGILGVA